MDANVADLGREEDTDLPGWLIVANILCRSSKSLVKKVHAIKNRPKAVLKEKQALLTYLGISQPA